MIKHRFILRGADDFKVFAAIPVENSLITWKRWQRPPDWAAAEELAEQAVVLTMTAHDAFETFRATAQQGVESMDTIGGKSTETRREVADQFADHIKWASGAIESSAKNAKLLAEFVLMVRSVRTENGNEGVPDLFTKAVTTLRDALAAEVDPTKSIPYLLSTYESDFRLARRSTELQVLAAYDIVIELLQSLIKSLHVISGAMDARNKCTDGLDVLLSSDPLPTTPCPPGLPFAAYTVEFNDTIVNVVEGLAWVSSMPRLANKSTDADVERVKQAISKVLDPLEPHERKAIVKQAQAKLDEDRGRVPADVISIYDPTPEEKRVVEIVSQMLTERSLNPKADTKIPVREIDPAKAHQTREAEKRSAAPAVRTIKFEVTPPRYLREAAEHILMSPRRAHWVIGHWRNQPYGEKHTMRRTTWIKPHIRGLGEASATTSRVVAPR